MAASLSEILQPQVILRVVSRIREEGRCRLASWLGFHPDRYDPETVSLKGPNTIQGDVRYATYRIFDSTRVVPKARAPQTGPATVAQNPMGDVNISCARFHEKIPLAYEKLGNLSPIVGPNSQIDPGGQDYIMRQERFIATQFNNGIELISAGMMQDNLWFQQQGDNWIPLLSTASPGGIAFQVTFQIPAGNKNQLNMLGNGNLIDVSWANSGAPIFKHLSAIKAAYAQLSGYSLTDVWVNSLTWYNIITNTELRNLGGSVNTPFAEYERRPENGFDGQPNGQYEAMLRADPTIVWHITDHVLATNTDIDPSYSTAPSSAVLTKMVPDNVAIFCTKPSSLWTQMYHGGEYVVENPGMPGVLRRGYYFWHEYVTQPSACELIGLCNAIPILYIPKVMAPATVVF